MKQKYPLAVSFLIIAGCATHAEWKAPAATSQAPDKPDVAVVGAVDVLTTVGLTPAATIDIRPEPSLPIAFERAIERYVDTGTFRIITAQLQVRTFLNKQTVILDMLVEVDGRSYRARHVSETANAGWGNKFMAAIPDYLDVAAKQIADQLQNQTSGILSVP